VCCSCSRAQACRWGGGGGPVNKGPGAPARLRLLALLYASKRPRGIPHCLAPSSPQVREQLQLLDPPLLLEQAPGVGGCGASVAGLGPRVYLLSSQGLTWGRLMPWSERLKTLQVLGATAGRGTCEPPAACLAAPKCIATPSLKQPCCASRCRMSCTPTGHLQVQAGPLLRPRLLQARPAGGAPAVPRRQRRRRRGRRGRRRRAPSTLGRLRALRGRRRGAAAAGAVAAEPHAAAHRHGTARPRERGQAAAAAAAAAAAGRRAAARRRAGGRHRPRAPRAPHVRAAVAAAGAVRARVPDVCRRRPRDRRAGLLPGGPRAGGGQRRAAGARGPRRWAWRGWPRLGSEPCQPASSKGMGALLQLQLSNRTCAEAPPPAVTAPPPPRRGSGPR
jgi:hypothetical protein